MLLPLLLAATAPYFAVESQTLVRHEVTLAAAVESGLSAVASDVRTTLRLPGLVMAVDQRDGVAVATVCPRTLARTDHAQGCAVFGVGADGVPHALGLDGLSAQVLPGGREALVWSESLELVRVSLDGAKRSVVARGVLEPRLSADGRSVGVAVAPGLERLEPGFVACPFVVALANGERTPAAGACDSQAPFVSSSGHTVAVATDTGIAGLVVDGTRISGHTWDDFTPVPGAEWQWLDGTRAVFATHYETRELWRFEVGAGRPVKLGLGSQPAWVRTSEGERVLLALGPNGVVRVEVSR